MDLSKVDNQTLIEELIRRGMLKNPIDEVKKVKKLKKVKDDEIDFSESLHNLFKIPTVNFNLYKSFAKGTHDYVTNNIYSGENINFVFQSITSNLIKTIENFRDNENIKFKLIINSEFFIPSQDINKILYYNDDQFYNIYSKNSIEGNIQTIKDKYEEWIDSIQEKESGFEFQRISRIT